MQNEALSRCQPCVPRCPLSHPGQLGLCWVTRAPRPGSPASTGLSLPGNAFSSLSCCVFFFFFPSHHFGHLMLESFGVTSPHYKAASLGVMLCHSQPWLDPRACEGAGHRTAQCTSVQSINQLANQPMNQYNFPTVSAAVGVQRAGKPHATLTIPMWPGHDIQAPGLICLMGRLTVLSHHCILNVKLTWEKC